MDLWDLTKVLFRRWYVAVPILLVSVVGVLLLTQSTRPDYSAVGYLQMIPPANSSRGNTNPDTVHNPWTDLGINSLAQAAIITVQDHKAIEDLVRQGYTENVILTVDDRSPLLRIEAVGNSAGQATGTVQQLMRLLDEQIQDQQSKYGVAKADMITTLVLDDGSNVTVVTTKVKRLVIFALGLGLLLTAASTIGVDALLGRRARRRLSTSAPPLSMFESALRPKGRPRRETDPYASTAGPLVTASPLVTDRPLATPTANGTNGDRPAPATYPRDDSTSVIHVDRPTTGPASATPEDDSTNVASDATIVLPLSHSRWSRRDDQK